MEVRDIVEALGSAGAVVMAVLLSPYALRLYAVAAALAVLVLSGVKARQTLEALRDEKVDFTTPGPKPKRRAKWLKRLETYQGAANRAARTLLAMVGSVVFFGYFVPTALLVLGAYCFDWLAFGGHAFVDGHSAPVHHPSLTQVVFFGLTQLARGALSDLMEVFGVSWGVLALDRSNTVLLWTVVGYRLFVGVWSVVFLVAAQRFLTLRAHAAVRIAEIKAALAQLDAA